MSDTAEYHQQALAELSGDSAYYWKPPLYIWWLKAVYSIFGVDINFTRYLQSFFTIGIVILTYLIGIMVFKSYKEAFLGSFLLALNIPMIFVNSGLFPTGIGTFLGMLSVFLFLLSIENPSGKKMFFTGISTGLGSLALPNLFIFVVIYLGALAIIYFKQKQFKKLFIYGFLMISGFLIFPLNESFKSYACFKQWNLLCTNGGINLYIGNNPQMEKTFAIRPGFEWYELSRLPYQNGCRTQIEAERYFYSRVWEYILHEPVSFLRNTIYKLILYFQGNEIPRTFDLYTLKEYSRLMSLFLWKIGSFAFPFGIIAPLAFMGMWYGWSQRPGRLITSLCLAYSLTIILVFPVSRYRVPVLPFFYIMAVHGVTWLIASHKNGMFIKWAVFICVLLFLNIPVKLPLTDVSFKAEMENYIGSTYDFYGNRREAFVHYKKSVEFDPEYDEGHFSLGNSYRKMGRPDLAIDQYEKVLRILPRHEKALKNLAMTYVNAGKLVKAVECFQRLVSLNPMETENYIHLAGYLIILGFYDRAELVLVEAIKREPKNSQILAELNRCRDLKAKGTGPF